MSTIKSKISMLVLSGLLFNTMLPVSVLAQENVSENNYLSPYEINEILADVEPIEVSSGVYLRDNGEVSIFDIDVSQFEPTEVPESLNDSEELVLRNDSLLRSWTLSTPYYASFKSAYRVRTSETFTGNTEFYVQYYDVNCPSGSTWKSAVYIDWTEIASSGWLSKSTTTYRIDLVS